LWNCGRPCEYLDKIEGFKRLEEIEDHNVFGYVAMDMRYTELIVSFRGTNGLDFKNWITNLNFDQVPYPEVEGAKVHKGWYNAYSRLRDKLLTETEKLFQKYKPQSIMITGHSLGGVLATFAALDLKKYAN
jgi:predicted lipase